MMPQSINNDDLTALKKSWLDDPCWDIENSEGFEAHKAELLAWRKNHEARYELQQNILESENKLKWLDASLQQAKALPLMALHETIKLSPNLMVTCVPNGFIYTTIIREEYATNTVDNNNNAAFRRVLSSSTTFVPYNSQSLNFEWQIYSTQQAIEKTKDSIEIYKEQLAELPADF